ncbi:MAG: DUF4249 family protein [Lewinellaceae bacterium]|nr:DUF4249 family protein [Saprospiraceae bacterium]MCB9330237.1 DUF4249 family protein [Lewinellaceae bacterium]
MKKLLFLLPVAALLIQACSNDFEVAAPWKEVPVAYAILAPKDTAQYIRVEKAFLDPNVNALQIAQIADSIYYPENAITVNLERVTNGQRIQLHRVDGNLEGYVREDGVFATQPNWLYKTKEQVIEGEKYRLVIERNDGKPDITAETTIPSEFIMRTPNPADIPPVISFLRDISPTIEWRTDVSGVYFSIQFQIRYRENAPNGTLIKRDTLYWTPAPNVRRSDQQVAGNLYRGTFVVSTESFYRFLVENIPPASDRFRFFDGIDITLEGGGAEIERYLETAAANSGITGAEVIPTYTNLSEGFGIFTSKNRTILNKVRVSSQTITDMNKQSPERDLNFQ